VGAALVVVALALAAIGCWISVAGNVVLTVDLEAERAGWAELWTDDRWEARVRVPVSPGRQALRFEHLSTPLGTRVRLDPTEESGARVRIHSIELSRGGVVVTRIAGVELAQRLVPVNAAVTSVFPFEIVPANNDPFLVIPGRLDPGGSGVPLLDHFTPERATAAATAAGIVGFVAIGALSGRAVAGILPALVALAIAGWSLVASWLDGRLGGPQSVSRAVGYANFNGLPKTSDFRLLLASFGFALLAGLALGRLVPRREPVPPPPSRPRWHAALIVGLPLAIFAALSLPDLEALAANAAAALHDPTWDDANFFTWRYFLRQGWIPLRDFWFPYGGFFDHQRVGSLPWGHVRSYAHVLLLMGLFAVAIWWNTRRSPAWTFAIVGVTVAAVCTGFVTDVDRYFLSLDLVLLFLAAKDDRYPPRALLGLAALGSYAFVLEPNQVAYAAVPIVVLIGIDMWRGPRTGWDRRDLARRFAPSACLFTTCVLADLVVLQLEGRLAGLTEFMGQMDAMTVYGSMQADVPRLLGPQLSPYDLVAFVPLVLVAFGGAAFARASSPEDDRLAAISLGTGLLSLLPASKHIVRPPMLLQIAIFALVGAALVLREVVRRSGPWQRWALGAAAALAAGFLAPAMLPLAHDLQRVPSRAVRTLAMITRDARDYARDEESYFFDVSRYVGHRALIERLIALGVRPDGSPGDRMYDLGDDALLYAALRQAPPYHMLFYTESPLAVQRQMAARLAESGPAWVVWRPASSSFDGVPNPARVPLMFAAAIEGYRPFEQVGDFDILRRGRPAPGQAVLYWRARLGPTLDLGAIPSLSELAHAAGCSGDARCVEALRVHVDAPTRGARLGIPVEVEGQSFAIVFAAQPGVRDYLVLLDRVWFWGPMRALGAHPAIGRPPPGCRAEVVSVAPDRELLW